jgi:hypothetical protein
MPMQQLKALLIAAILVAGMAACGASGFRAEETTDRYRITFTIDQPATGVQRAIVELTGADGAPVSVDSVVLAPVMRDMGHVTPEITLAEIAPGRYEGDVELFSMTGAWEIEMRIGAGGIEETATFRVVVA